MRLRAALLQAAKRLTEHLAASSSPLSDVSLPRRNRLKRQQDFATVYRSGVRRSTPHLTLRALNVKNRGLQRLPAQTKAAEDVRASPGSLEGEMASPSDTRIGVSISRKVSKRAVVRNRIRRQIQTILRQLLPQFQQGWLITIVVHPKAIQCRYSQFLRELEQLLVDAEVINGH